MVQETWFFRREEMSKIDIETGAQKAIAGAQMD
jgi:hypothetical protein